MIKKCNLCLYLFSVEIGLEIRFNNVLDRKETFFSIKAKFFKFSWVNPCLWSKKFNFFLYLFLFKIRLEIRFNNVLERKETFFDYKNKIFQSSINSIFPKGLTQFIKYSSPMTSPLHDLSPSTVTGKKASSFDGHFTECSFSWLKARKCTSLQCCRCFIHDVLVQFSWPSSSTFLLLFFCFDR